MSPEALLEFIAQRTVTPRPDCVLWANAVSSGYGRISLDGKSRRVHRVVWEIQKGPIPKGMTIDHLCRVRSCVNTEHMELVTAAENTRRAAPFKPPPVKKARVKTPQKDRGPRLRVRKTHCQRGHEFTVENTRVDPAGRRMCVACAELLRVKVCKRGHPFTPESTGVNGRGQRYCRICNRDRVRERYWAVVRGDAA